MNAENTAKKSATGVPFVKGDPRINREGRPKGSVSVVEAIKKKLQEEVPPELTKDGNPDKKTYRDYLVATLMKKAINEKDVGMIKDIIDRVDGKPKQAMEMSGELKNINIEISKEIAQKNDTPSDSISYSV